MATSDARRPGACGQCGGHGVCWGDPDLPGCALGVAAVTRCPGCGFPYEMCRCENQPVEPPAWEPWLPESWGRPEYGAGDAPIFWRKKDRDHFHHAAEAFMRGRS